MNANQQFIVALVVAFLTALVPLIPFAMKLFFQANGEKLYNLQLKTDQFKETIKNLCGSAEALFKEGNGQAKYDWVVSKISDKSLIPADELKGFIESALLAAKEAFATEWFKLGHPAIEDQLPNPEPSVTPTP